MIYAQIKTGIVFNIIVLDDESLAEHFKNGFDHLIRIDELTPSPQIGWSYDGIDFNQPPEIELEE